MRTDTHTDRQMNKSAYRVTFQINLDATKKKRKEKGLQNVMFWVFYTIGQTQEKTLLHGRVQQKT